MRVWLLGGFRVSIGARTIDDEGWRLRKAAALVKVLSLAHDHRLYREQIMELLWPGLGKKSASNNLRTVLHAARKILSSTAGAHYLANENQALALCPGGSVWVDVHAFEEAAARATRSREPAAYREAIDLCAGDLLPKDRYEGWAEGRREELRQLYLALLIDLAGLYETRDEHALAIEALSTATDEEPMLEEAHAALMRLHAHLGRPEQALAQYERFRDGFFRELGTEPSATIRRLRDEIASGRFLSTVPAGPQVENEELPDVRKHNLPVRRTRFIGREQEMVEVKRTLSMTGLLTLTGAGGCGKTRLALEVANNLVGIFPDGVWLVELAPLSEETLVPQALAATLGVKEQPGHSLLETFLDTSRDKDMLLILDNCEHLVDAAARLADALLDTCPRLRLLATSREPLGVPRGLNWHVPSLSTPGVGQSPTVEELERYESVRLFADRASNRNPGFKLTPENTLAVAQVCARLEGIALAIELAAARVGMLSVEQIFQRLGHSLKMLTRGERNADHRHQTLRATLDWSYELLGEPEQVLFGRLSVFAGGFTLEAAEIVGAGGSIEEEDVLELLTMLVDKSLVVAEENWESGARYRLLETIRQYCQEKLEEGEEQEQTKYRHAQWYLALAEEADKESSGPGHARWLQRLESEHGNLRAALEWSLEGGDAELGLRLAGALWLFWFSRGYASEGRGWLERSVALGRSPVARANALNGAGWIVMFQGDYVAARRLLEESLALYRELKDEEGIASSINFLGYVALLGQWDDLPVTDLLKEALGIRPRLNNRRTIAGTLIFAGLDALLLRGDWDDAVTFHEEALALYREMGDKWGINLCLVNLGLMAAAVGHHVRAKVLLRELMHLSEEVDDKFTNMYSFFGFACVADSEGRTTRAARLWGISEAIREAAGLQLPPSTHYVMKYEERLASARFALGEAEFGAAWDEGKGMTHEEAVEYALSEEDPVPKATSPEGTPVGTPVGTPEDVRLPALTHREREVAVLVTQGLTNRQISTNLGISDRTAGNHVAKILKKCGLRSRAQIATWVTETRLPTSRPD